MKITKATAAKNKPNPHGVDAKKIHDNEHAQVMHLTLQPGQALKKHITPVDIFFYVLEGKGDVEIGEERETTSRDSLIDSPAGIPHCWYNTGEKPLRILVVKTPRPTDKTVFVS